MKPSHFLYSSIQPALSLLGKTCLVTGGSQGIGLSIAQKFAQEGASVILLARNKTTLETALTTLSKPTPDQSHSIAIFDVSKRQTFKEADIGTVSGFKKKKKK